MHIHQVTGGVGKVQRLDVEFVQHELLQTRQPGPFLGGARAHDDLRQRLAHLEVGGLAGRVAQAGHALHQFHVDVQLFVDGRRR